MYCKVIIAVAVVFSGVANSASTYDQRQSGDFNVQVDLKHLQIIGLLKGGKEEYVDYDYAYDYSEMTIKPQRSTTPKPLNFTTIAAEVIKEIATIPITAMDQTTSSMLNNSSQSSDIVSTTSSPMSDSSISTTVTILDPVTTLPVVNTDKNNTSMYIHSQVSSCKKGFVMNQKGDCELKIQATSNALLKLVKLSQKLKLRRENRQQHLEHDNDN